MKIAIGSDHGGFEKKREVIDLLTKLEIKVLDVGAHSEESCDYPDYAKKVALSVSRGQVDRGILLCGSGIGMSIAANKVPGVRAAVCWNIKTAGLASEHNHANILCLSGRFLSSNTIVRMVKAWLKTPFASGRHQRRIEKIDAIETQFNRKGAADSL